MKTNDEIEKEIEKLKTMKPHVRRQNFFGDDHHDAIDAQVKVLEMRMRESAVFDTFEPTGADDIDMDEGRTESVCAAAMDAWRWMMDEEESTQPSESWKELMQ